MKFIKKEKIKKIIEREINYLHWGQFVLSKFSILIQVAILFGVYRTKGIITAILLVASFVALREW